MMMVKKSLSLFFLFSILIFISSVESLGRSNNNNNNNGNHNKILLNDVQTLTLKSGEYTKAKRTTPIKQMECNGGTAQKEYQLYPNTIQCYNMGSNGNDVQWKCEANLDTSLKLGKIDVSCEGYLYPDDPYITAGSCGVFYELEYSDPVRRKQVQDEDGSSWFTIFIVLAFIAFIFYAIYNSSSSSSSGSNIGSNAYSNTASDNNYPGGFPGTNSAPPPPNNPGYQGYPNINNHGYGAGYGAPGCNNNNNNFGGGWLPWAGAGLAYLWGRNSARSYHHTPSYSSPRTSSYRSSSGGSGFSSSSSSYSGTSRR